MKRIICLCSGGIDSFALLHFFKKINYKIIILYLDYGQLASEQEYKSVKKISTYLKIENVLKFELHNYGNQFSNSLVNEKGFQNDFFPGRNLLLLSIAASIAFEKKINEIGIGIIKSRRIFPDCKADFIENFERILYKMYDKHIGVQTPLASLSKRDVIKYFKKFNLPINITYSCQKNSKGHCGKCPSCIERFKTINEVND